MTDSKKARAKTLGIEKERQCVKELLASDGCIDAFRASGSLGRYDVHAYMKHEMWCIQVKFSSKKGGYVSPCEFRKVVAMYDHPDYAKSLMWVWERRRGWRYYIYNFADKWPEIPKAEMAGYMRAGSIPWEVA